jgi:hypothetical protein
MTYYTLPVVMAINTGIQPRKSINVCNFIAPFFLLNSAQLKILRHRSMVEASMAYNVLSSSRTKSIYSNIGF